MDIDGTINCDANTEPHRRDLCKCDSEYAMAIGASWNDQNYNFALWAGKHNQLYTLDRDAICVSQGYSNNNECCGSYPNRVPYDSSWNECCEDGTMASLGSC